MPDLRRQVPQDASRPGPSRRAVPALRLLRACTRSVAVPPRPNRPHAWEPPRPALRPRAKHRRGDRGPAGSRLPQRRHHPRGGDGGRRHHRDPPPRRLLRRGHLQPCARARPRGPQSDERGPPRAATGRRRLLHAARRLRAGRDLRRPLDRHARGAATRLRPVQPRARLRPRHTRAAEQRRIRRRRACRYTEELEPAERARYALQDGGATEREDVVFVATKPAHS